MYTILNSRQNSKFFFVEGLSQWFVYPGGKKSHNYKIYADMKPVIMYYIIWEVILILISCIVFRFILVFGSFIPIIHYFIYIKHKKCKCSANALNESLGTSFLF